MIKIENLNKYYQAKKGPDYHALRDINIEFGTKGFVFLLGKSGSGKSTLLNIIGGLDRFDNGEIMVKDKSTKKFNASAWDSYRNTYVGFVFQDYSIIEDYSIGKNIGLALELQGEKKKNIKPKTLELLKKVDLANMINRKPNELSGGQKQRIAIARALIKDPQIILADEPTGALDSNTSTQILDNLRQIANERLIIMVSHDKDSAYKYADRIVTMSDGIIINDEYNDGGAKYIGNTPDYYRSEGEIKRVLRIPPKTKFKKSQIDKINNIIQEDESTLYVPLSKGDPLTDKIIATINKYSENSDETLYLPLANNVSKIQGSRELEYKDRENPAEAGINEDSGSYKKIKSKLPLKNSIGMAFKSIGKKKVRLFFSSLIFLVSLTIFGFSETMNRFDYGTSLATSYKEAGIEYISMSSSLKYEQPWGEEKTISSHFSSEEVNKLREQHTNIDITELYNLSTPLDLVPDPNTVTDPVAVKQSTGFLETPNVESIGHTLIGGSFPTTNTQLVITDFMMHETLSSQEQTNLSENSPVTAAQVTTYLGTSPTIEINKTTYDIVGVLETDFEKFLKLNDMQIDPTSPPKEYAKYISKESSIYTRFIVKTGFYDEFNDNILFTNTNSIEIMWISKEKESQGEDWPYEGYERTFFNHTSTGIQKNYYTSAGSTLSGKQILMTPNMYANFLVSEQLITNGDTTYNTLVDWYGNSTSQGKWDALPSNLKNIEIELFVKKDDNFAYSEKYTVVGFFELDKYREEYDGDNGNCGGSECNNLGDELSDHADNLYNAFVFSNEEYQKISPYTDDAVHSVLFKLSDNQEENIALLTALRESGAQGTDIIGLFVGMISDFTSGFSIVFLVISLVFASLSTLLLVGSISASVLAKKRDIGTLRAIGARGKDVGRIFIFESLFISTLVALLSVGGLYLITNILNPMITKEIGVELFLFNPTLFIFAEQLALGIVIGFVAAFIPVKKVSSMKPIDAIKNK